MDTERGFDKGVWLWKLTHDAGFMIQDAGKEADLACGEAVEPCLT